MRNRLKRLLAALGLTILLVVGLEAAARLTFFIADEVVGWGATEAKGRRPAFEHVDYDGEALLDEQDSLPTMAYEPYAVWRSRPFAGRFFHVGADGRRLTLHGSEQPDALSVWMFGGSTTFGYGAPDSETIASHLARLLDSAHGLPSRVVNHGQGGYVSTQELVLLVRELQSGERPDVVLFYDGYNDAVSARNWPHAPGAHFQIDVIRGRFETSWMAPLVSSGLFRGVKWAVDRAGLAGGGGASAAEAGELAAEAGELAARVWLANYEIAQALADRHGFELLFLLQPSRPTETASPHAVPGTAGENKMAVLQQAVRRWRADRPRAAVHDLTGVLADVEVPVYIDSVHLTGLGNRRVAEEIAVLVARALEQRRAGPTGAAAR